MEIIASTGKLRDPEIYMGVLFRDHNFQEEISWSAELVGQSDVKQGGRKLFDFWSDVGLY